MSGAGSNSRFLTRLLTIGEEDFERVSVLKEELVNWLLAMLILSISVIFNVNCLTAAFLITKWCQQCWPIHSCLFYKVVQQQIWGLVVYFRVRLVAVNFCLQQWKKNNKIGQYLPKLLMLKWTRAQLLPRMADRTRAVKTTLFTSALRRIFSNR